MANMLRVIIVSACLFDGCAQQLQQVAALPVWTPPAAAPAVVAATAALLPVAAKQPVAGAAPVATAAPVVHTPAAVVAPVAPVVAPVAPVAQAAPVAPVVAAAPEAAMKEAAPVASMKEAAVEKEEVEKGSTASVILLGGIAFVFVIFYMVNSHLRVIREQTWSAISTAVSIFVAVMTFGAVNALTEPAEAEGEEGEKPLWGLILQLLIWWLFVGVMLFVQRNSKLRLYAYGVIGGHLLGFVAIDTFSAIAGFPTFTTSPYMTLVVFAIYVVAIQLLSLPLKMMFSLLGKVLSVDAKQMDACHEQATDTSTDFFCMGASFLIAMSVRGIIKQKVVKKEAESRQHTSTEIQLLFVAGVVCCLLCGVFRNLHHKAKGKAKKSKNMITLLDVLATTFSLTCAWCLLDAGNWYWMHHFPEEVMVGHVAVAVQCTVFFVVAVIIFAIVISRVGPDLKQTLRGEFTAVGLLLGLSWEHVFDAALEGVHPYLPEEHKALCGGLITLALVLVVFPSWVVYMVPKHDEGLSADVSERGLMPLDAFCECFKEEYEEGESEDEEAAAE